MLYRGWLVSNSGICISQYNAHPPISELCSCKGNNEAPITSSGVMSIQLVTVRTQRHNHPNSQPTSEMITTAGRAQIARLVATRSTSTTQIVVSRRLASTGAHGHDADPHHAPADEHFAPESEDSTLQTHIPIN